MSQPRSTAQKVFWWLAIGIPAKAHVRPREGRRARSSPLFRWFLVLALGWVLVAPVLAAEVRPDALHPSARVIRTLPSQATPTSFPRETPPELSLQVGVGRTISTGLVIGGSALALAGALSFPAANGYAAYGSLALAGVGTAVAGIGTGVALGTATALRTDGARVSSLPGWIALGGMVVGGAALVGSPYKPELLYVAAGSLPVLLIGGFTQLILNENARHRLLIGAAPTRGGGMATVSLRF